MKKGSYYGSIVHSKAKKQPEEMSRNPERCHLNFGNYKLFWILLICKIVHISFFVGRWFNPSSSQSHFGRSIGFFWGPLYVWGQNRIQNLQCDSRHNENYHRCLLRQINRLWQTSWADNNSSRDWHDARNNCTGTLFSSSVSPQEDYQKCNGKFWIDHWSDL